MHVNKYLIIAVDISCLTKRLTGIGRYTLEILLALKDSSCKFILYSPVELHESALILHDYYDIRVMKFKFFKSIFFWQQLVLPFLIYFHKPSIFWSPNHRFPFLLKKSIKLVVTIHDFVWKVHPKTMRHSNFLLDSIFIPLALRYSSNIITVSESTKGDIKKYFPKYFHKVRVTYLGSDHSIFCGGLDENNLPSTDLPSNYILFVGTLEPRKNLTRLLQAYSKLPEDQRQMFNLIIVGGQGWGGIELSEITNSLNISDSVVLIGFVDNAKLAELYFRAQFLIMPSLYEGFGLPLVEAMRFGVPSITSNVSSMPEVVGDAGITINPFSVDSIFQAVSTLIQNKEILNELKSRSISRSRLFSWNITAQSTLSIFVNLISVHSNEVN